MDEKKPKTVAAHNAEKTGQVVIERTLAPQISTAVEEIDPEIQAVVEEEVKKRVQVFTGQLLEENRKRMQQVIAELKDKMAPPKPEDIQKLLDQEYLEFKIELPFKGKKRTFVLKEMPQAIEKKFYDVIKKKIVPLARAFKSVNMNLLDGEDDLPTKMDRMINMIEPMLDVITECAAIALDPRGEDKEITPEWVTLNLSSSRIMAIVNAQAQCNRMRDFFSSVSQELSRLT